VHGHIKVGSPSMQRKVTPGIIIILHFFLVFITERFLVMRAQSFMTQEQQKHMEQGFNQFLHKSSHGLSFLVGYLIRVFKQIVKTQDM
jgi:hypothetical protein